MEVDNIPLCLFKSQKVWSLNAIKNKKKTTKDQAVETHCQAEAWRFASSWFILQIQYCTGSCRQIWWSKSGLKENSTTKQMLYKIPDHMLKDKCNCSSPFTAVLSIRNSNLSEFCQTSWIHRRMVLLLCSHHISNKHICKWKDNAKEAVHQNIDYKKII